MFAHPTVAVVGGTVTSVKEYLLLGEKGVFFYNSTVILEPDGPIHRLTCAYPVGTCEHSEVIVVDRPVQADTTVIRQLARMELHADFTPPYAGTKPLEVNVEMEIEPDASPPTHYHQAGENGLQELVVSIAFDGVDNPRQFWLVELAPDDTILNESEATPKRTDPSSPGETLQHVELTVTDVKPGHAFGFRWVW